MYQPIRLIRDADGVTIEAEPDTSLEAVIAFLEMEEPTFAAKLRQASEIIKTDNYEQQ